MAMKYADAQHGAAFLACVESLERAQAARLHCSVGAVRCVVRVSALRSTGAQVGAADVSTAGLGEVSVVRGQVAECLRLGLLVRVSPRGPLELSPSGRALVADTVRAWARAVRQLLSFAPAHPFPSLSRPKERAKRKPKKKP